MMPSPENLEQRAWAYATDRGMALGSRLGRGIHGTVFSSSLATAVKVHIRSQSYTRELACYKRLCEHAVTDICGHRVPQLVCYDDDLCVIEMTIVAPPFLLDFAGAYLGTAPEFPADALEQDSAKNEEFGSRWGEVQAALALLGHEFGIYMVDINRGNITFGE